MKLELRFTEKANVQHRYCRYVPRIAQNIYDGLAMDLSFNHPPNELDATSTRLIHELKVNEKEAWEKLIQLYGPVVRFWLKKQGLEKTDIADVFQEVFIAVSKSLPRFQKQNGIAKFRSWLKTITYHRAMDFFRRRDKQVNAVGGTMAKAQFEDLENKPSPDLDSQLTQEFDQDDANLLNQQRLKTIRNEFSDVAWKSFWRMTVDGLTSKQVAEELGITSVSVRKNKSRILARVKEEFEL